MLLKLTEPQAKAVRLKMGIRAHPRAETASAWVTPSSFNSLYSFFLAREIQMSISIGCYNCYDRHYHRCQDPLNQRAFISPRILEMISRIIYLVRNIKKDM